MGKFHGSAGVLILVLLLAGCAADGDKRVGAGAFAGACFGAFGGPIGAGVGFGLGAAVGAIAPEDTYQVN